MNLTRLFHLRGAQRPKFFISYRRDDSDTDADFLSERLARHFGKQQIFVDKDAIPIGKDFIETVEAAVASCDALLAVIGKQWLVASDGLERRLDDPNDIVRFEIASALCRDILVIPVLVRGARMPRPEELPGDLKNLTRRHAFEISRAHRREDVERLIVEIEKALAGQRAVRGQAHSQPVAARPVPAGVAREASRINTKLVAGLSAATLLTILVSLWLVGRSRTSIVSNPEATQPTVSSPSPSLEPSPTPEPSSALERSSTPQSPTQEATSESSPIGNEQPVEAAPGDTPIEILHRTSAPTPSPQPETPSLADEAAKKNGKFGKAATLDVETAVPSSLTLGSKPNNNSPVSSWPIENQLTLDDIEAFGGLGRGKVQTPIGGGREVRPPYRINSPYEGQSTLSPYAMPTTTSTPAIDLSPDAKYESYLRMRKLLGITGPPLPRPTPPPFRPRPK
jgi:hypothetical protein